MPQSRAGQIVGSAFRLTPLAICDESLGGSVPVQRAAPGACQGRGSSAFWKSAVMIKDAIEDDMTSLDARGRRR
jgi:hypothetical protein